MKKVLKFVKGRKEEKRECGGVSPSASGDVVSGGAQTPEEEGWSGAENGYGYGYSVDFCGKDKTLTKLHKAAWQGNLEKLKSALKKVEVDAVDRHNRTALHLAVAHGHPNIVWFLLGNNAKTSVCDDEGHSPLLKAIECGHKECMTLLLDRGADVNVADYSGNTGLHIAVSRGSLDTVSSLLKKAADTELRNNAGDYPLHIATKLENKELVDLLLAAGASLDVLDRENRTPLMLAAKTGNSVLVKLFIERGGQLAVVDSNGWTAQDYAMLGGHEDIASSLSARNRTKTGDKPSPSEPAFEGSAEATDRDATPDVGLRQEGASSDETGIGRGDKQEDPPESPDAEAIPPYCQPPRSWEMIQAGMIDRQKDGSEAKRRSITALGTLHSRRESFAEPAPSSPRSTLSLNRRRRGKDRNALAKHRFSLNEEESVRRWVEEGGKGSEGAEGGKEERGSVAGAEGGSPEGEKGFPPPPSGLELGVDMAKSIRCMRGLSVEQPPGRSMERKPWKKAYESHSLDCLEEGEVPGEQVLRCQKPRDRLTEVSRRINEQLECYDQALRELAESSRREEGQNYYSLPCKSGGGGGESGLGTRGRKRHMLLAMRDVRHGVGRSSDEGMASPPGKAEEGLDSDERSSPKGVSSSSGGNSPLEENPFFGVGRQETVVERESEGSGTGEESTLWLQDEAQRKENSDEDVAEICAEEGWKHRRDSSFSPLGVIQREMEEESRGRPTPPPGEGLWLDEPHLPSRMNSSHRPENDHRNEQVVAEQSPDVSLSSGPIEPLGAEKDSGSEAESSHNDVSPAHTYALKSQHEWLRCHLKAATSEKNKLEELTAQLTEKAERLQYELADAKEAAKSRDEVIRLLQGQLARMEAAYTKSLEESVQSRLQLTCHEQEILHLKEVCYRYQEEKEAAGSGTGGEFVEELQLRIKMLEEEKERMREEMSQLEEEKSLLEGQLRVERQGGAEMMEQCQRWKERCGRLEVTVAEKDGERVEEEKEVREQRWELEKKVLAVREENAELRGRVESLGAMVEQERRRASGAEEEKEELRGELKRQKAEVEGQLRKLEKEMEEKMVRKLKEREEEVGGLVAQFNRERKWLMEGRRGEGGRWGLDQWRREKEGMLSGGEIGGTSSEGREGRSGARCSGGGVLDGKEEVQMNRTDRDLEFLELKKQVLFLESKIADEKKLRQALENEMLKMRINLNEKENLEMEVNSLKRKVGRHCLGNYGIELLEYGKDLETNREKYLGRESGVIGQHDCDYKAKCEVLAKEREKAKHLSKSCQRRTTAFASPPPSFDPSTPPTIHPDSSSHPQLLLHPRQLALHPDIKNNLDYQLDKSIRRYMQESASIPSVSNLPI